MRAEKRERAGVLRAAGRLLGRLLVQDTSRTHRERWYSHNKKVYFVR
jgi:hypothetical protein